MRTIAEQLDSGIVPDLAAGAVIRRAGMQWSQLQAAYQVQYAISFLCRCTVTLEQIDDESTDEQHRNAVADLEFAHEQYADAVRRFELLCGSMELEVQL